MRLIKIDPQNRTVECVESDGSLEDMYRLIDCRMIDVCARQRNGDALTIDDESLFLEPQPAAFSYNGFGRVHGVAILSGADEEGATCEPTTRLEEAIQHINWLGELHTSPMIIVTGLRKWL